MECFEIKKRVVDITIRHVSIMILTATNFFLLFCLHVKAIPLFLVLRSPFSLFHCDGKKNKKEMDKRELLGVQKRKRVVKKNKKKVLKKVVDYLRSDSYMFAPLISPPLTNFLASRIVPSSSTTEVETTGNKKQRKKRFIQKVGEYLKSDTYLYSHLCVPQHPASPKDFNGYVRRVTMEISTRKLIREDDQSIIEASNITVNNEFTKCNIPGRNISGQQKVHTQGKSSRADVRNLSLIFGVRKTNAQLAAKEVLN